MESPVLEIFAENLVVSYDRTVALEIPYLNLHGKIVAIIGHNGSGKSTLIKTLLGLLIPRAGSCRTALLQGASTLPLIPEKHMAFSPETGAVFGDVSVESYIKLWCRIKHGRANYYRKEGSHYIERMEIQPLLKKLGRELSKGQRRRVQSAVGFLTLPKLFLFDEPFDGLDIAQSNQLSSLMLEESEHMCMVISSHRMEVVERLADLIILLENGRVATYGSLEEVCSILCGQSIVISNAGDHLLRLVASLREQFLSCLVHTIGGQISITGSEINLHELAQFLAEQHYDGMMLKVVRPSLVDAVQYHLKKLH